MHPSSRSAARRRIISRSSASAQQEQNRTSTIRGYPPHPGVRGRRVRTPSPPAHKGQREAHAGQRRAAPKLKKAPAIARPATPCHATHPSRQARARAHLRAHTPPLHSTLRNPHPQSDSPLGLPGGYLQARMYDSPSHLACAPEAPRFSRTHTRGQAGWGSPASRAWGAFRVRRRCAAKRSNAAARRWGRLARTLHAILRTQSPPGPQADRILQR